MISFRRTLRRALSATADAIAKRAYRRLKLARDLTQYCRESLTLRQPIVTVAARQSRYDERHFIAIRRRGNRIKVVCAEVMILQHSIELRDRLCAALALIGDAPLASLHVTAEISDGEVSGPGLLSLCSRDSRAILIPDHLFVLSRGYEECRQLARANRAEWGARSDRIVWRGSTTGGGIIAKDDLSFDDTDLIPRVRLCLLLRGTADTDVKISAVVQSNDADRDGDRLAKAGILGPYMSPIAWHSCKFAIDIDGNSNAWSNLFIRLIMGCCVLKVASPTGYRQWYYDDLKPWSHYVPVTADLSDLQDRIAWCRANLDECRRIAAAGQEFAMVRSYEAEIASGIRRLCEACDNGTLRTD
jgi:hypothetical protein